MDMIEVENLIKKFGDFEAVKGISFTVRKGEIFAFLGPNGAGKTTTVHILTTLLKPTAGKARVGGLDVVRDAKDVRKKIGIVFQDPSIDRDLTAYENMLIHGGVYGLTSAKLKEKIRELLKFVELWDFKDKLVRNFSGGMQRRLEIARSLLHEPEVLFLDEPTLGLDPQTRAHVWSYIKAMKEERDMTIFLTTHYMEEAEKLADRVAIIDHGRIIAEGTCNELKKMVGGDVVYVKTENNAECFKEVGPIKACRILRDGVMRIDVDNAAEALPKIFEIAREKGVKIVEMTYHKPTLNDVFLHLTGREIRDEGGDLLRTLVRSRMRR